MLKLKLDMVLVFDNNIVLKASDMLNFRKILLCCRIVKIKSIEVNICTFDYKPDVHGMWMLYNWFISNNEWNIEWNKLWDNNV